MISTMICGGLGNQLFQYAAGRALAVRHNTALMLNWAPPRLPRGSGVLSRPFELNNLHIRFNNGGFLSPLRFILARRRDSRLSALSGWRIFREKSFAYDSHFPYLPDRTYLFGYWHSWRYFEEIRQLIFKETQPRLPFSSESSKLQERMLRSNSLAMHIRRGDYVTSRNHDVLGLDYYAKAARLAQDCIVDLKFFVFSDDPKWCANALQPLGLNLTIVDFNKGSNSWQDVYLMSACRHAIIANSTFSWWGAWRGDFQGEPNRLVVAPERWFPWDDTPATDRYPPAWMIVQSHGCADVPGGYLNST